MTLRTLHLWLSAGRHVQFRIHFDDGLPDSFARVWRFDGDVYGLIWWHPGQREWIMGGPGWPLVASQECILIWLKRGSARLVPQRTMEVA